jgi:hypothetical protein
MHVQVTEPLVFRATGPPQPAVEATHPPSESGPASAPAVNRPSPAELQTEEAAVQKVTTKQPTQRSFFGKLRRFFAAIFR